MVDARTPMDVRPLPALRVVVDDDDTDSRAEADLPRSDSEHSPIRVVLACSTADAEQIAASAALLGIPGLRVLTGVDRSNESLRAAVLRATVSTLFVVCRAGGLDADRARAATAAFGSRRLVHHRLLVAQYDPARPGPWMTAVRRAWTSMAAALEVCSGQVDGMLASSEYSVVGGEVRGAAVVAERRVAGAPLVRIAATRAPTTSDSPLCDRVGTIPAHVRTPSVGQPAAVASTKVTEDDGPAAISDAVLVRDEVMPPALAAAMPTHAADRWIRATASAVVALVVVGFAAVPTLGEAPTPAPTAALSEHVRAAVAPSDRAAPPIATPSPIAPAASTDVAAPAAVAATPARIDVPASPDAVPAPPPTGATAGAEGRLAVLLVVDGPNVALDWHAAANTCRARRMDGTRGFRLPNIDELRWLRRTGRVRAGRAMWSGSRVHAQAESNWIVDAKGSMVRLGKDDKAFTVCVRAN